MKDHITDGTLQSLLADELTPTENDTVQSHLSDCEPCQQRLKRMTAGSERRASQMDILDLGRPSLSSRQAYSSFQERYGAKEIPMHKKVFQAQYRFAGVIAFIALIFVVSMLFPAPRALAIRFLSLFRVQRIVTVDINLTTEELPRELETQITKLERLFEDRLDSDELSEPMDVEDGASASQLAGFSVRLPADLEDETTRLIFQQARSIRYRIDLELLNSVLDEMGYGDTVLPESIDGEEISIWLPDTVGAMYGECAQQPDPDAERDRRNESCTVLIQGKSPVVELPPEIDPSLLGEIFLQIFGMPSEEAKDFSQNVDWTTTLVLPMPMNAEYQEINSVDGVPGVLVEDEYIGGVSRYSLIWIKGDILYGLSGYGNPEEAIRIANSLQ